MKQSKVFINKNNRSVIEQARFIRDTLGMKIAAGYLRNRNWSIESTIYILLGK